MNDSAHMRLEAAAPQSRRRLANALRFLAIDAVEAAKSGHPGMPMGMADIAEVLWRDHLRHSPADPSWPDRDRFVLSNGHGSMLLYAALHLSGYDLPLDELKRFRQLHAKTPGHPEVGLTPGVETTTGPLGQGLANGVGMAFAEKLLAARFNRPGFPVVDHHTYVFLGDGCLMEGVSHEAGSLAGTLGLGKLICFYDDNGISIDGHVSNWFTDDTAARFRAYGWNVIGPIDGHDATAVDAAIRDAHGNAKANDARPSLIVCRTTIGWGSPNKADTHEVHGAPLGAAEIAATRHALDWDHPPFEIPDDVRANWSQRERGAARVREWNAMLEAYRVEYPDEAAEFERRMRGELPADWTRITQQLVEVARGVTGPTATRKSSQIALDVLVPELPDLFGGSADLTGSNLTAVKASRRFVPGQAIDPHANYLSYGVREFGMMAIMNGMALHGGFIPYGGTFLVFSDYARNAIRMSALMKQRVIHVLTHDSIGLGEDGPTHQPIEHLASLRLIPGLDVWRPCDTVETAIAWQMAIERANGPTSLVASRQNLPQATRDDTQLALVRRGGYVLSEATGSSPDVVIIATGSEVALALAAQRQLGEQGVRARVVSMPSTSVFDRQDAAYRAQVLPPGVRRVAVEAAHSDFWHKYVGPDGRVIGLASFGESAPAGELYAHFGVTVERVVEACV
ncbi:transketolase 1, thiamin-binding [Paraburkholderia piptadeniae]|uniref:Transketolase n=1 Tax=Paraburkholderia piptadeniae TaxID=1701573 RepID=A0A1N7S0L1_9BURK|nr:transketolase [Paraburkholderia piptadeniae]SIT40918.1 transketolase 1, thiamin-binding [Paraburkholderia piptadeniae]